MTREPNPTQAEIIRLLKTDEYQTQTEIADEVGCADSTVSTTKKAFQSGELQDPDSDQYSCQFSGDELHLMAESLMQVSRTKTGEERDERKRLAAKILDESSR